MSTRPSRLVLVDPCLDGAGSHPWQYAVRVLEAARRRGWGCDLVCRSSAVIPAGACADWRVWKVLRYPGASKLTAFAELDRLAPDGRPRRGLPWEAWARRRRRCERIAAFAADLEPVIASLAVGDRLVVATASELDAVGLARAIRSSRPPEGIGWHLQFHAPLLPTPPAAPDLAPGRLARVGRCIAEAIGLATPHRLHFHTPTEELAAEWSSVGAEPISVLPYPVDDTLESCAVGPHPRAAADRFRVALLGDARAEKNSHLTPALLDRIAATPDRASRLAFAIQTNPGFDPRSRRPADLLVTEALATLSRRGDGLVVPLAGPLAADAYRRQIDLADVFLLPYDQRRYRQRCSAILLEALAAGRVPIVTGGGWMARRLVGSLRAHLTRLERECPSAGAGEITAVERTEWTATLTPPAGAGLIIVELVWTVRGSAALLAEPTRLTFGDGPTTTDAVVQPDPDGRPVPAVFRLRRDRGGPARLTVAPAFSRGGGAAAPVGVRFRWLRGGGAAALGSVGIVVADADGSAAALAEFLEHADHYRASAAEAAAEVRRAHAPARVLEGLLA